MIDYLYHHPLLNWTIVILLIVLYRLFQKNFSNLIGKAGEFWVKRELRLLPKNQYFILNDIMLEINNQTHQIDHVVVSNYGIFIIETKQYNGYITGGEYDKKWKKKSGKKIYYFQNPIHQNYGHLKAIQEAKNIEEDKLIPIVCIPSRAKVQVNVKSHVVSIYKLLDTIKSYRAEVIQNKEEIYNKLSSLNIIDKKRRKEHIKYIKTNIVKYDSNICPKCGHTLVKRNGPHGEFIGCSNYPKCKYTKK